MRNHRLPIISTSVFITLSLACGGGEVTEVAGGLVGPSASAEAQALCAHLEEKHGGPCTPVAVGQTQAIGEFEVRVDSSEPWTGVSTLPQVKNGVERSTIKRKDGSTLAVTWTVSNTSPVKAKAPFGLYMIDGGGNQTDGLYFNTRLYGETVGMTSVFAEDYGPSQTIQGVTVFPVAAGDLERSLMVLDISERKPDPQDPKGRMKTFITEQVVMDLGVAPAAI